VKKTIEKGSLKREDDDDSSSSEEDESSEKTVKPKHAPTATSKLSGGEHTTKKSGK
jgi:hypothetical protein